MWWTTPRVPIAGKMGARVALECRNEGSNDHGASQRNKNSIYAPMHGEVAVARHSYHEILTDHPLSLSLAYQNSHALAVGASSSLYNALVPKLPPGEPMGRRTIHGSTLGSNFARPDTQARQHKTQIQPDALSYALVAKHRKNREVSAVSEDQRRLGDK